METNIFEKIRDGEEKADIVYRDNYITAFKDIDPNAPVHILIIPNKTIVSLNDIQEEDSSYLSNILLGAKKIAKQFNIDENGVPINNQLWFGWWSRSSLSSFSFGRWIEIGENDFLIEI